MLAFSCSSAASNALKYSIFMQYSNIALNTMHTGRHEPLFPATPNPKTLSPVPTQYTAAQLQQQWQQQLHHTPASTQQQQHQQQPTGCTAA
jgi:hypothetical protein